MNDAPLQGGRSTVKCIGAPPARGAHENQLGCVLQYFVFLDVLAVLARKPKVTELLTPLVNDVACSDLKTAETSESLRNSTQSV